MDEHIASRPDWSCAACLKGWPCDPSREQLAIETGGGTALRLLGWSYFEEYALEAGPGPFSEAFERFVGWT